MERAQTPARRIKRGWMNLLVTRIIQETSDCRTLIFVDNEEQNCPFDYIAGQYLTFRFDDLSAKPVVRSYTMSSSPNQENFIAVTVKEVENGFISKHLCRDVKPGDILRARGPIGKFTYFPQTDPKHLVMIGAGSGVTPFLSMLRQFSPHLGKMGYPDKMTLLASFRSSQDIICSQELKSYEKHPNIKIEQTLSREKTQGFRHGRISGTMLAEVIANDFHGKVFLTCGPVAMMDEITQKVLSHAVDPTFMRMESFAE